MVISMATRLNDHWYSSLFDEVVREANVFDTLQFEHQVIDAFFCRWTKGQCMLPLVAMQKHKLDGLWHHRDRDLVLHPTAKSEQGVKSVEFVKFDAAI